MKKRKKEEPIQLIKYDGMEEEVDEENKKKKSKILYPEYIFIFDDLSNELKNPVLSLFICNMRHFKTKFIISSQYWNNLDRKARAQHDIIIIFKDIADDKLEEIYKESGLTIPFDKFLKIYKFATKEPYNFLYINTRNGELCKNFNIRLESN